MIFVLVTCKYIGINKVCSYAYVTVYRKCKTELKTAKQILFIKLEVTKCMQRFWVPSKINYNTQLVSNKWMILTVFQPPDGVKKNSLCMHLGMKKISKKSN